MAKGVINNKGNTEVIQEVDGQILKKEYDNNFCLISQEVISNNVKDLNLKKSKVAYGN